jgi:hypothetical protein
MMRGAKQVTVPFLGMNNQLLDDQSLDGLCDSITNLKPKGNEERPYWVPFEKINTLKNPSGTNFSYPYGISSITDAFWQIRNFAGEYSLNANGSLKRLLVLCQNSSRKCIDIVDPATWTVVKTQALPQDGNYSWSCTRLDEVTVIAINKDKKPFLMYYLIDDAFIPAGWPDMPEITVSTTIRSFSSGQVDAGNTQGVLRKAVNQWFLVTWAFRLNDGTHVRHNSPVLIKVESGSTLEAELPLITLVGYSEAESLLIDQPFWKGLIAGISVCATLPREEQQKALDDGAFFEIGYFPFIDKLPAAEWQTASDPNILIIETKSDSWATGRNLGIDNFTHHRYASRVTDTYNKRLLLGGSSVDFALPRIGTNASQNTVPGGVYTDYLNYNNGIYSFTNLYFDSSGNVVPDSSDPAYNYETNLRTYEARFSPNTGREFKTSTILESFPGANNVNPPGGPTGSPSAAYTAAINGSGQLSLEIDTEETTFGSGGQFGLTVPYMKVKVEIGPVGQPADQTIIFTVSPAGNSAPYLQFSNVDVELGEGEGGGVGIYFRVTIKTDSGTYYRIKKSFISEEETELTLPEFIWYPDRRATRFELIVENDGDFEVALNKQLIQHPQSNYSYALLSTAEQTYTIGDSIATTTEPDLSVNLIQQYVPNRIQASVSSNPLIFDAAATYRVGNRENDTILGFGINLNPTSEGQAGQYPVYAFSDKGVWALEQTGDPEIAFGRITPVSNFNGINNLYAITNAQNMIIATDNKYIYALSGLESTRIDEAIANDVNYKDFLKQVRIGYHRATDYEEVIFSNPFHSYSLCYNLKYKVWYKATERFKFFFYDYPELMGLTTDNVLKDFSDKDEMATVQWEMTTRVMQLKEPYVYKRIFPSYLRLQLRQPVRENPADYSPVRIQLLGYRDTPNAVYTLYDQSVKTDALLDHRIYNQYGSMYAYRLVLNGTNRHRNAQIQGLDAFIDYRYMETRRRMNASAQYIFANGETGISIFDPNGATGKYFYVHPGYVNQELFTLPASVHGFTREPDVTLRDQEGYTFEAPVKVHPTTFDITILVKPAIPYRILLT